MNIISIMKRLFFTAILLCVVQVNFAQAPATKAQVMKLITLSGSDSSIKVAKDQIINMIPTDKREAFLKEFDATLPALYDSMADIYVEMYNEKDVKDMIAFYESPVGKKMSSNMGTFTQKIIAASQTWGADLQGIMAKYAQ
ncbi:hypothetical protein BJQ96_02526 [Flavobacterium sp. PL0002]|nr:hypothetical protein [Flavobacterium sp. PL002]